uniref:Uncharacterized protein n=1 Tax=Anguilla anguilla TaxID=7936 RepID=A0A0E9VY54_ANGAN
MPWVTQDMLTRSTCEARV